MFFDANKLSRECLASKPDVWWNCDNLRIAAIRRGLVNISVNFLWGADPTVVEKKVSKINNHLTNTLVHHSVLFYLFVWFNAHKILTHLVSAILFLVCHEGISQKSYDQHVHECWQCGWECCAIFPPSHQQSCSSHQPSRYGWQLTEK